MLMPKKTKYRKQQKGRVRGYTKGGYNLNFGDYGLQALECGLIRAKTIEACRIAMTRALKRGGKIWIRIFPDKPLTRKPAETRMGKGKGSVEEWAAVVKRGRIMFEIGGVPKDRALEALRLASYKLPIKTKIVTEESMEGVLP